MSSWLSARHDGKEDYTGRCLMMMNMMMMNDGDGDDDFYDNGGPPQALATKIMTAMATTILMPKRERGTGDPFGLSPTDARLLSRGI